MSNPKPYFSKTIKTSVHETLVLALNAPLTKTESHSSHIKTQ